eukprot:COSAG01_NODE_8268_length_2849_cov_3.472364_5_plen_366_part_00
MPVISFVQRGCQVAAAAAMSGGKYYAVRHGRSVGVFRSWSATEPLVRGFSGARYKSFTSRTDAEQFVAGSDVGDGGRSDRSGVRAGAAAPAGSGRGGSSRSKRRMAAAGRSATSLSALPAGSLLLYTDGGCDHNTHVRTVRHPAGWGVVGIQKRAAGVLTGAEPVMVELWGPVELSSSSPFFLGAEVASNNTGELSGFAEALYWLRDTEAGHQAAALVYDSEYAADITEGRKRAHKNVALARRCQQLLQSERARRSGGVCLVKVKGHSGDRWNDHADSLAERGKSGSRCDVGRFRSSQPPVISASSAAADGSERVVAQHQQEQESVFQRSVSQRRRRQLSHAEPTGRSVAKRGRCHATDTTTVHR